MTPLEQLREMKKFIAEYQFTVGLRSLVNLPDISQLPNPNIVIPRELVIKFRNDYLLLTGFAAHFCNTSPDKLCALDLLSPFLKMATDSSEE
jgi:hypothetical protein